MRTCALLCLLLATAPLVSAHEEPPGPTRLGTVTGRVILPGPSDACLKGVEVQLLANFAPSATTVTDSTGTYTLRAPGHSHAIYSVRVEPTGYDPGRADIITILPDSVTRMPDIILWPVRYFDWATYKKFMSTPSVEVHPKSRRATGPQDRDSTLLKAYHHYLHPDGPLVVRTRITLPWAENYVKQWPDIKEYGQYLFIDKGRCRFMKIQMWVTQTGMRLWEVDSMEPGRITKGGWIKGTEESLGWSFMDGLKLYLHPCGTEFVSSRGTGAHD